MEISKFLNYYQLIKYKYQVETTLKTLRIPNLVDSIMFVGIVKFRYLLCLVVI